MKITNIVESFLISMIIVFVLFCVFWAGVYSSYMQYYGIREFFNPFFGVVFNPFAFFFLSAIFGVAFLLPFIKVLFRLLFVGLFICALLLFITPFGKFVGLMLVSKNVELNIKGETKVVQALYENANYIVYLSEDSDDFETRKKNLVYFQKPNIANTANTEGAQN